MSTEAVSASNSTNKQSSAIPKARTVQKTKEQAQAGDLEALNQLLSDISPGMQQAPSVQQTAPVINIADLLKEHDTSAVTNSHINTRSFPVSQYSFVATPLSAPVSQPSTSTLNIVTGDNMSSILVDISLQVTKLFENYSNQLTTMSQMPSEFSMSLWKLLATTSNAVTEQMEKQIKEQEASARSTAESAAKCGIISSVVEVVVSTFLVIAAVAAAIPTGGASIAGASAAIAGMSTGAMIIGGASIAVGLTTGIMMLADGMTKLDANVELLEKASGGTGDIEQIIRDLTQKIQFGIFSYMGGAKAEMWFNIISSVLTVGTSAFELGAAKAAQKAAQLSEKGVEAGAKVVNNTKTQIFSLANSATSSLGMIMSGVGSYDDSVNFDNHDGKQHTMLLWQSMSNGIFGTLLYSMMRAPLGKTNLEEQMQSVWEYFPMIFESVFFIMFAVGANHLETQARKSLSPVLSPEMMNSLAKMGKLNALMQTSRIIGQTSQSTMFALQHVEAEKSSALAGVESAKLQLVQTGVESIIEQNSTFSNQIIKKMTSGSAQVYSAFLKEVSDTLKNQGRSMHSMFT